jgi:hypothetical protein
LRQQATAVLDRCLLPFLLQDKEGTEFGLWLAQTSSRAILEGMPLFQRHPFFVQKNAD